MEKPMTTRQEAIKYCMKFQDTYEDYPFHDPNWTCMRLKSNKRIFAWIYEHNEKIWINVKCDPEWRDLWRNAYESVLPAYHMNKEHWNSIILDGTIPTPEIHRMIAESHALCAKKNTRPKKR